MTSRKFFTSSLILLIPVCCAASEPPPPKASIQSCVGLSSSQAQAGCGHGMHWHWTPLVKRASCHRRCGGKSYGRCWCDSQCNFLGDCCADKSTWCDVLAVGADCTSNAVCGEGLACIGKPSDGSGFHGKCRSLASDPGEGLSCSAVQTCGEGLRCAGLQVWKSGHCVPAWMAETYSHTQTRMIPDDATALTSSVVVYGLASVPVDIVVRVDVNHPRPTDLRFTLTDPNGVVSALWDEVDRADQARCDGATPDEPFVVTSNPLDDQVNGRWTLSVVDLVPGAEGALQSWSLELTSRWD